MFQASSTATAGRRGFSAVHPASHPTQGFIRGFSAIHPTSHPTQGFIRGFSAVHPASHPTQGIYKDGQDKVTQHLHYAAGLNGNIVVLPVVYISTFPFNVQKLARGECLGMEEAGRQAFFLPRIFQFNGA